MNFYECCDLWFKYYTISTITLYIIEIDSIVVALLTYNLKFQNKYLLYIRVEPITQDDEYLHTEMQWCQISREINYNV